MALTPYTYRLESLRAILMNDRLVWDTFIQEDGTTGHQWDTRFGASYEVTELPGPGWVVIRLVGDETGGIVDETTVGIYATLVDAQIGAVLDLAAEEAKWAEAEDRAMIQMEADEMYRYEVESYQERCED